MIRRYIIWRNSHAHDQLRGPPRPTASWKATPRTSTSSSPC